MSKKLNELLKVEGKFDGVLHCKECGKAVGYTLLKEAIPVLCVKCMKKCKVPFDSVLKPVSNTNDCGKDELVEMRKHFANNPGVLKLIDEQEERNRLIEQLDYLDKVEYDAEQQSNKDFYEALGVEDPDLKEGGE